MTQRRGAIYLIVLLTTGFVLASGLVALSLERSRHDKAELDASVGQARRAARSTVDLALQTLEENPDWRDTTVNGYIVNEVITFEGQDVALVARATDLDGSDLTEDPSQPFLIHIAARSAEARRTYRIEVLPALRGAEILQFAAYAAGGIQFKANATAAGIGSLATAGSVNAVSSDVSHTILAAGAIKGRTFAGTTTTGAGPWSTWSADPVATYSAMGTTIAASTPTTISGVYLDPATNPFDAARTNPNGVYVINNGASRVQLDNSRVVGTLVFTGTGEVTVGDSCSLQPYVEGYPAIVAAGGITMSSSGTPLLEINLGKTLNSDLDLADTFADNVDGLIYADGDITVSGTNVTAHGLLFTNSNLLIESNAVLTLNWTDTTERNPPPAFGDGASQQYQIVSRLP